MKKRDKYCAYCKDQIEDKETWSELKSGKFSGFSIEVWMSITKTNFKNQKIGRAHV